MQKGKRANGQGSIEVLPSGKARIAFMKNGKRFRKTLDTEAEARAMLATLNGLQASGELVHEGETLNGWLEKWLAKREIEGSPHRPEVKSIRKERIFWRLHIQPTKLGAMPLAKIRPKHVEAFALALRAKERTDGKGTLGPGTQKHVLRILRQSLKAAVKEELIKLNPATDIYVAGANERTRDDDWLRADEIDRLLACEEINIRDRTVYACAIGLALRLNDLKNLRLSDVILNSVSPGPYVQVTIQKTNKPHRVPILPWLMPWIERHIASLPEGSVYLFPTIHGKPYASKSFDFNWAKDESHGVKRSALEIAGIERRVRFHDLRGTCATHLALGTWGRTWTLTEVCQMLAHSDQRVTERYVRRALDTLSQAAQATPAGPGCPSLPTGELSPRNHSRSKDLAKKLPSEAQPLEIVADSSEAMGNGVAHTAALQVLSAVAAGQNIEAHARTLALAILESEAVKLAQGILEAPDRFVVSRTLELAALVLRASQAAPVATGATNAHA